MENLKTVLMRRDNMNEQEALDLIQNAREDLHDRLAADEFVDDSDFMAEWFGLEPDYIMELI